MAAKHHKILALIILPLFAVGQTNDINDLKKELAITEDTARINSLNNLSYQYILSEKRDSATYFANKAGEEANRLNYAYGIAIALSLKSQIAKHFHDNFALSEKLAKESLTWFDRTNNKEGIDIVYYYLAYNALAQSRFAESIEYTKKNYAIAKRKGDQPGIFSALNWMFAVHRQSGDYEKSFSFAREAYDLALKANNKIWISTTLYGIAQLYTLIEDYPNALLYFRKVLAMDDEQTMAERVKTDVDIWFKMEFAEVFSRLGQFDSAWHYYKIYKPAEDRKVYMRVYWVSTGECFYLGKDYHRALQHFQLALPEHRKLNDRNEIMRTLLDIGRAQVALDKSKIALSSVREGLDLAIQTNSKQYIRDGYQLLSTACDRLHQPDSANFYFRKYIIMKDAVLNDQTRAKFDAYSYEQKIALMSKEKEIADQWLQIQQQRLEQQALHKRMLIGAMIGIMLLGVIVVFIIMFKRRHEKERLAHELAIQKLESEKIKADFERQSAELKMESLRTQMNPHFIFNSLGSINLFILKNNKAQASEYLSKFSKLVRLILQNSHESFVPLESELEGLRLYLELESLRFEERFDYNILVDDDIETTVLRVPPLVIQPFVENAIWHGLMHKQERGYLDISLYQNENILFCKITDNGIGRKKAAELKSKSSLMHKSMGMRITTERLSLIKGSNNSCVTIKDLVFPDGTAAGTEVLIKIPVYGEEGD
jgi:tetratricopeptide (TPR) repeat protein